MLYEYVRTSDNKNDIEYTELKNIPFDLYDSRTTESCAIHHGYKNDYVTTQIIVNKRYSSSLRWFILLVTSYVTWSVLIGCLTWRNHFRGCHSMHSRLIAKQIVSCLMKQS